MHNMEKKRDILYSLEAGNVPISFGKGCNAGLWPKMSGVSVRIHCMETRLSISNGIQAKA